MQEIDDTTIPDLILTILPPECILSLLRSIIEVRRQRGQMLASDGLRWLERIERIQPHVRHIGPGLNAEEWYGLEKLLFVATSGDADKVKRARRELTNA
jgi:hypothetical protein